MGLRIIFITGGARSGKSRFALEMAESLVMRHDSSPHLKAYIATAEALDDEMKERIERHKDKRGADWYTFEEPVNIASLINKIQDKYNVILLDCLTLWLSNIMHKEADINKEIESLISSLVTQPALRLTKDYPSLIFIVSNEVGMGIVPENDLARRFREWAGFLNQKVAEIADEVYFMVSGIPVKIKG